jgi:hypothetical protein
MLNRKIALVAPWLVILAILSGCEDQHDDAGPMRTESRKVEAFEQIVIDGDAELKIQVGASEAVSIRGYERALERTKTEVRDATLYINTRRKDWIFREGRPRINLTISLPKLTSLNLKGGNSVRITGYNGGKSRLRMEGAVELTAAGQLEELVVHMSGAGQADLGELIANDASVTVDGVGNVVVHSKDSLRATMNGVGSILYQGSPHKVNTTLNGVGRIGQRDDDDEPRKHDEDAVPDSDKLQPEYEDKEKPAHEIREVI